MENTDRLSRGWRVSAEIRWRPARRGRMGPMAKFVLSLAAARSVGSAKVLSAGVGTLVDEGGSGGGTALSRGLLIETNRREPELTVSIVTYNSGDDVLRCLDSLVQGTSAAIEVVVIDNASTDGMPDHVAVAHPEVRVVPMGRNAGFAAAHNRAMAETTAPYLLVLNPDTIPEPGSVDLLLRFARDNPRIGAVAPRLRYPDGRDQGTARAFPTAAAGLFGRRSPLTRMFPNNRWSRRFLVGLRAGDEPFRCDWVSGACMLVPRSVVDDVGGFDERYFLFWEDADWCRRMADKGYEVWTVPASTVVHDEGGSRGRAWPEAAVRHFHRGAYLYWRTHVAPQPWNGLRWVRSIGDVGAGTRA